MPRQVLVVSLGFLQADWAATPWCEADEAFRCPPHPRTGTGRAPATSAPGLRVPLPHLRRDWALVRPCDLLQPLPDSSDGNERPKDRTTVVISSDDDSEDDSDEDSGDGAGAAAASSDGCGMDEKIGRQQAEDGRNGSDSHRPAEPSHQASRPVHLGVALYLRPFRRSSHSCVNIRPFRLSASIAQLPALVDAACAKRRSGSCHASCSVHKHAPT